MKLRELPNTVVHCRTKEEYDRLMQLYEQAGWRWCGGDMPTSEPFSEFNHYDCNDRFQCGSRAWSGETVISLSEFLRIQGISPTIEIGKKYRPTSKARCRTFANDNGEYVVITKWETGDHRYDIYDMNHKNVGSCCGCFSEASHLEPYEEKPEEFKIGEWMTLTEDHSEQGFEGKKGDVFRCKPCGDSIDVQLPSGCWMYIYESNRSKFRPCSPPEEKREEPETFAKSMYDFIPSLTADILVLPPHLEEGYRRLFHSPSPMSMMDYFNNSVLSSEERTLRKADIKDSCGRLTSSGEKFVLAFLADKFKADLVKEAKKYLKARKGEEDED